MSIVELRIRIARRLGLTESHAMLLWGALAGALGAIATIAFRDAIRWLQQIISGGHLAVSDADTDAVVELAKHLAWYWRVILPTVGGLIAGALIIWSRRLDRPGFSTDYMDSIALGNGHVPVRQTLVRSASSLVTIVSGGSIGREGAMVQLAAMCGSLIGRVARFHPERLKLLVACGAAAGITSAYNAPIAGAFFVTEIVLGTIAMERFGPIVVASVVANIVMRAFPGYHPTYAMPAFPDVFTSEQWRFAVLGILVGIAAPAFLKLIDIARQQSSKLPLPIPARLALAGSLVGAISIAFPEVWGNGYSVVSALLHQHWVWTAVLAILFFKIVATMLTIGSGAIGGIFTPAIFVGSALGWLFGAGVHAIWPHATSEPFVYAIVGMGAFLAGASGAPLMAILMIFEMTLSYQAVLPLMLACVLAYFAARGMGERYMYSITSVRMQRSREKTALRQARMQDLVRPAKTVLSEHATFAQMMAVFAAHPVKYVYIVDAQERYIGVVALLDLTSALSARLNAPLDVAPPTNGVETSSEAPSAQKMHDTGARIPELARDFVRTDVLNVVTPDMSLAAALERFVTHQGERLPVIASQSDPRLLGVVYKTSLLNAYSQLDRDA